MPKLRHNEERSERYVRLFFEGMNAEISKIEKAVEEDNPYDKLTASSAFGQLIVGC